MKPKLNQGLFYGWQFTFCYNICGFVYFSEHFSVDISPVTSVSDLMLQKEGFSSFFCAASKWASLVCRIFYQGLGQKTCNDETHWRDENKFMKKRFWLLCEADFGDFGSRLKLRKPKDFCFLKLCNVIIDITLQFIEKNYFILFTFIVNCLQQALYLYWMIYPPYDCVNEFLLKSLLKCEFATVVLRNQNGELSILTKSWHLMTRCCARHFKQISHYSKVFSYF